MANFYQFWLKLASLGREGRKLNCEINDLTITGPHGRDQI